MKKILFISLIIIICIVTALLLYTKIQNGNRAGDVDCDGDNETIFVAMKDDGYTPPNLTIKRCTTVVFKNEGQKAMWPASDLHPTHGIYPEFDPLQEVVPGDEWSFVFEKVGKWKYHDHISPIIRGVIEVTE